jgi:hypothetical protein
VARSLLQLSVVTLLGGDAAVAYRGAAVHFGDV